MWFFKRPNKCYSLSKSRKILKETYTYYKIHWKDLSKENLSKIETNMQMLDKALAESNKKQASDLAKELEVFKIKRKKPFLYQIKEIAFALIFALVLATIARQMWFELYQVPTGSMRPTIREKDRIVVSKTEFGINVPLTPKHLYFDESLVKRAGSIIFTVEDMDMVDQDTKYLYIFPGKKRLIKRCMGKPGDTLYFYGGQIYGIGRDGNELLELRSSPWLEKIEHVPFMSFNGNMVRMSTDDSLGDIYVYQINQPLAKLSIKRSGDVTGKIYINEKWESETPAYKRAEKPEKIETYGDFWGINNYGMARLLTKEQLLKLTGFNPNQFEEGILYLEIKHSPSMTYPKPKLMVNNSGKMLPALTLNTSIIPLQERHLRRIMENMYTARFIVKDGHAARYHFERNYLSNLNRSFFPKFEGVENGTYEFYYGKAYKVGFQGYLTKLPEDHSIYELSPENVQKLFNLGVEFNTFFGPESNRDLSPSRYTYFRNGDLFLLGGAVIEKDDPTLISHLEREEQFKSAMPGSSPYISFKDRGAPLKEDGTIDVDFIKTFGLKIPDKMYLALGDNHAMSSDSRAFGFVPEENLRGRANFILSPPGERFLSTLQGNYNFITFPRLVIWSFVAFLIIICYIWIRFRSKKPIFKKLSS